MSFICYFVNNDYVLRDLPKKVFFNILFMNAKKPPSLFISFISASVSCLASTKISEGCAGGLMPIGCVASSSATTETSNSSLSVVPLLPFSTLSTGMSQQV